MGKLFNLKKWLTVPETVRHLATLFGEEVTEADVLRLALDGHLRLSVNFVNHTYGKPGKVIPLSEAKTVPGLFKEGQEPYDVVLALRLNEHDYLELDEKIVNLTGVWDLLMMGSEELDIEHKYQQLTGGPAVTLTCLDGAFVKAADGTICELQESYDENEYQCGSEAHLRNIQERIARDNIEPSKAQELLDMYKQDRKEFLAERKANKDSGKNSRNYYPASGLPADSVLVVRADALREFEAAISGAPAGAKQEDTEHADPDKELAELFDPVRVEQLEAMFPDDGRWAEYANRAASNALIAARKGRAQFNPYRAARWWLDSKGPTGWKWERCLRVLANNLPARSRDSKHLLTGNDE